MADFEQRLHHRSAMRVVNYTGVGGIGKSRLLAELIARTQDRPTASLDLRIPALRQHEDGLAVLRRELGGQKLTFPRFDIAYTVLWQRLHPHMPFQSGGISFVENSAILMEIADAVTGMPFFGTARSLLSAIQKGKTDLSRRRLIETDPTLGMLDDLSNEELSSAVTYLFAEEIRAGSAPKGIVLAVDGYEPLQLGQGRNVLAGDWLQDFIGQLSESLVLIASREPLLWYKIDSEWASLVSVTQLSGLPKASRNELLRCGGLTEDLTLEIISEASQGSPFFLNLALDTAGVQNAVSQPEILNRFLEHVPTELIKCLEILSPARFFNYNLFTVLADDFRIPADRGVWDRLISYSFILETEFGFGMHQLMRSSFQSTISPEGFAEMHYKLATAWKVLAAPSPEQPLRAGYAWREAVWHGLMSRKMSSTELLSWADDARHYGGLGVAQALLEDLEQIENFGGAFDEVAACLRAEAAVRAGDAHKLLPLTRKFPKDPESVATLRLALAAGHAMRLCGQTESAMKLYSIIWQKAEGVLRIHAGLWLADLEMAQGNCKEAMTVARTLSAADLGSDRELEGDIARLKALICHFSLEHSESMKFLQEAREAFATANSPWGLAQTATNRAEFLAIEAPSLAVEESTRAIELNQEINAYHEIGKAYTARATAYLLLNQIAEAQAAIEHGLEALTQAGYRSGLARAQIIAAIIQARKNHLDESSLLLQSAVADLQQVGVYPSLIMAAERVANILHLASKPTADIVAWARANFQCLGNFEDFNTQLDKWVAALCGSDNLDPRVFWDEACKRSDNQEGYYNKNIHITSENRSVMVRHPLPEADVMDLKMWSEVEVLRAVRASSIPAPRLLFASESPRFSISEFQEGELLEVKYPRNSAVPTFVLEDIQRLFSLLHEFTGDLLPSVNSSWPATGDTPEFAERLSDVTAAVYDQSLPDFDQLFNALGIPTNWLATIKQNWERLSSRPFAFLHGDLHRKNIIFHQQKCMFLDWELALWGDPVYDLVTHIHKMSYNNVQRDEVFQRWLAAVPEEACRGAVCDMEYYLVHERVKSAIVDTVRTAVKLKSGRGEPGADLLSQKLRSAATALGFWGDDQSLNAEFVARELRHWAIRT